MCRQKISDHVETLSDVVTVETEYLPNGDLLNLLTKTRCNPLPETAICFLFIQILEAIEFLHESVGIAHRDLKPENIGFTKSLDLSVFDFGEAIDILETSMLPLSSATSIYATPERKHTMQDATSVDMWCAGLILLYLFVPEKLVHPLPAIDVVCTFSVSYEEYMSMSDERAISPRAFQLLKGLLTWETHRFNVSEAQDAASAWAESLGMVSSIAVKEHLGDVLGLLRSPRSSEMVPTPRPMKMMPLTNPKQPEPALV
jgi:serine/threonine protein kinase